MTTVIKEKDEQKNKKEKNWFVHAEFVVLMISLLGGFMLLDGKIERQIQRSDRLYEMYCDSNKQWAEARAEWDKKFYDLLKDRKG